MSVPIPDSIQIGSRIQIGKDRATVKFIGSVKNTKGEWLGIEWDDAQRGKHDGLHQDTRYFTCRYPTSGSFIRYHSVKVNLGTTFFTALNDRYIVQDDITVVKEEQKYDPSKDIGQLYFGGNSKIVVETYGFEKIQRSQRQLSSLKVVGLAEQLISSAGPLNEIRNAKLAIGDLDLSRNLVSNWETILEIVSQLPSLVILRINQSRLLSPPSSGLEFNNLKSLALNQTLTSWQDIELLAPQLPQLEELQLGGNEISQLSVITHLKNLKWLNLEDNLISDWNQVSKLGFFLNLEILYLNDNQITKIDKPTETESFAKLRFLRIENNKIDEWSSLDALNHYPSLTKLRCKGNPVFKDMGTTEDQSTQLVGRIKNLLVVNGNTLTNRERTDLERFYLKSCTKDGATHEAISLIHPRYTELCQIHGEPDIQIKTKAANTSLKNRLITITLTQRGDIPTDFENTKYKQNLPSTESSITKRFLLTMTIRNVKNMISRLIKIPASKQQLYLLQSIQGEKDRDLLVMDINDELRDLKFYGINDGDEILILS